MENIMGNTTLAAIRARLQASETKTNKQFDNAIYPFWNIPTGGSCSLRLLPDGDNSNDFFWVEKLLIKLPFPGVVGQNNGKAITVTVPCVEMWRNEYPQGCPVLAEVRAWYKDDSMKELANKYWKKRSYITQGFVRESSLVEENMPENPIRRFVLGSQIFNIMKAALLNPEIENLPTDYTNGTDFKISKTQKAQYADYATSSYSRKDTPLNAAELEAIEKHGLFNLSEFLPKKPTDIELKVIKDMFEASVDGQMYDPAKWGQYYKPFGLGDIDGVEESTGGSNKVSTSSHVTKMPVGLVNRTVTKPVEEDTPTEEENEVAQTTSAPSAGRNKAQDILSRIQSRNRG